MIEDTILEIDNLSVSFNYDKKSLPAVDNLSLSLQKGKTLGIVGESGSGKTVTALSILRLLDSTSASVNAKKVSYKNQNLLDMDSKQIRTIRGNKISMIFQEPMSSLNPVFTCGNQIIEVLDVHRPDLSKNEKKAKALELLDVVGIPDSIKRFSEYPHQLSGGMRQRVMMAMALVCNPDILIADEPTTALDVTIQAQILDQLKKIQKDFGMSLIIITHDLGVVLEMCDEVIVMYCGRIVEQGSVDQIFNNPLHPYTNGLMKSVPNYSSMQSTKRDKLFAIPGLVPPLSELPLGCSFQERCANTVNECFNRKPNLTDLGDKHFVACYNMIKR